MAVLETFDEAGLDQLSGDCLHKGFKLISAVRLGIGQRLLPEVVKELLYGLLHQLPPNILVLSHS